MTERPCAHGDLTGIPRILSRRWIAWKLVQLAHRIYDATFYERLIVRQADDESLEVIITGDLWGNGVSFIGGKNYELTEACTLEELDDDDD